MTEFLDILRTTPNNERGFARIRGLPMSPGLDATFAIMDAQAARQAADIPDTQAATRAGHIIRFLVDDTQYDRKVASVASAAAAYDAEIAVYGRLLDVDLRPTAEAYAAEAADYEATLKLAYDTAVAAFDTAHDAGRSRVRRLRWGLQCK